jgi:hypothetical protein
MTSVLGVLAYLLEDHTASTSWWWCSHLQAVKQFKTAWPLHVTAIENFEMSGNTNQFHSVTFHKNWIFYIMAHLYDLTAVTILARFFVMRHRPTL